MNHSILFSLLLFATVQGAIAQVPAPLNDTGIARVEVSGIALGRLSPGLRQDLDALVGSFYTAESAAALAARIEQEQPEFVAAVRAVPLGPDGDIELIFMVARISGDRDLESNINARYMVEDIEITGVPETGFSAALRADMHALVGQRLDPGKADEIQRRIEGELSGYDVYRRIERGSERGRIRLNYHAERKPWIPFTRHSSQFAYHSRQGFGALFDVPAIVRNNHRFAIGSAFHQQDDLIERYSGFRLSYENRMAGTERLGVRVEFSRFGQKWRRVTLLALETAPDGPEAYRTRQTIEPAVTLALSPELRVRAGASFSNLESYSESPDSQTIGVGLLSIHYDDGRVGDSGHGVEAAYEVRTATGRLESDLIYTRHFGEVNYEYERGESAVEASLIVGRISGPAPLFERFSLGNTSTLRGWNKFDIAPAGGDRVAHHSLEYRFHGFAVFYDLGSVWDHGAKATIRVAGGFGFHDDAFSMTVGFPINAESVRPILMAKVVF